MLKEGDVAVSFCSWKKTMLNRYGLRWTALLGLGLWRSPLILAGLEKGQNGRAASLLTEKNRSSFYLEIRRER
jgi:hypothetical protein